MSPLNSSDARRIFESLDQNNDGLLSLEELVWLLEKTGVHASEDELTSLVGLNGLDFDDFVCFYDSLILKNNDDNDKNGVKNDNDDDQDEDEELRKAFKVFDLNGDGFISSQELQNVLWKLGMWEKYGGLDCERIISKFDVNCDGFVDFDEFKGMMLAH
ncbi:unnamed protein product [Amaranthus hypochondriacus]